MVHMNRKGPDGYGELRRGLGRDGWKVELARTARLIDAHVFCVLHCRAM